jgi:hypothetical protein
VYLCMCVQLSKIDGFSAVEREGYGQSIVAITPRCKHFRHGLGKNTVMGLL